MNGSQEIIEEIFNGLGSEGIIETEQAAISQHSEPGLGVIWDIKSAN